MRKDLIMKDFQSSFLSCENDTEKILRKLFIDTRVYRGSYTKKAKNNYFNYFNYQF